MVTRAEAFPSRYLQAKDVGQGVKWVIANVAMGDFKKDDGSATRKLVATFQNPEADEKLWVINVTNYNVMADLYGEETDGWTGREIVLFSAKVPFGHKTVDGIRCRAPKKAGTVQTKPTPAPQQSLADEMSDDIPF